MSEITIEDRVSRATSVANTLLTHGYDEAEESLGDFLADTLHFLQDRDGSALAGMTRALMHYEAERFEAGLARDSELDRHLPWATKQPPAIMYDPADLEIQYGIIQKLFAGHTLDEDENDQLTGLNTFLCALFEQRGNPVLQTRLAGAGRNLLDDLIDTDETHNVESGIEYDSVKQFREALEAVEAEAVEIEYTIVAFYEDNEQVYHTYVRAHNAEGAVEAAEEEVAEGLELRIISVIEGRHHDARA